MEGEKPRRCWGYAHGGDERECEWGVGACWEKGGYVVCVGLLLLACTHLVMCWRRVYRLPPRLRERERRVRSVV